MESQMEILILIAVLVIGLIFWSQVWRAVNRSIASTEATVGVLQTIYDAMPPEAKERAAEAAKAREAEQREQRSRRSRILNTSSNWSRLKAKTDW
jgi:hypothetical protein